MGSKSYKDLIVWQKAMDLVIAVYEVTSNFPQSETYGLARQMQNCAVSIPSNIAEGSKRGTKKDFRYFILIAYGSGAELETQIEIMKRLPFGRAFDCIKVNQLLDEVMKMLNALSVSLRPATNYKLQTTNS